MPLPVSPSQDGKTLLPSEILVATLVEASQGRRAECCFASIFCYVVHDYAKAIMEEKEEEEKKNSNDKTPACSRPS